MKGTMADMAEESEEEKRVTDSQKRGRHHSGGREAYTRIAGEEDRREGREAAVASDSRDRFCIPDPPLLM